ncbi:probable tubulin polyglutamylase TTLL2 [Ischnura elegans]|uniref:probable tubulin polyglutamylase TTLL2 n=1 Tax=Ischnura elegans TaxID=197161 RepID=UPI001ED8A0A4|nr:probable tubulin polyglutamylase TTLL2 [Ischnura elegans]
MLNKQHHLGLLAINPDAILLAALYCKRPYHKETKVKQVCLERGWRDHSESSSFRDRWNLWWRTSGFPLSQYKQLKPWQFTNHVPKGSSICRKDSLARYLRCMKKVYGSIYDFSPPGYNLPLEYTKLVAECSRRRGSLSCNNLSKPYLPPMVPPFRHAPSSSKCSSSACSASIANMIDNPPRIPWSFFGTGNPWEDVWICKPVGQSQGRGIFLFREPSELCYDSNAVVQRYIPNPLLIGGYKFDLRLYVCVPSFHPLVVYLYQDGLARFATDKFALGDLSNVFRHLTNSSLNKLGPGYTEKKERVGAGCKWTLKQLRHYFHQTGVADWFLWQQVSVLVVLTVLSQVAGVPSSPANCFEFFGFDVLIDSSLRPWLLEVNVSPALGTDCDADASVKKPMLHDLFDLLGFPVCNTGLNLFTLWDSNLEQSNQGEEEDKKSTSVRSPKSDRDGEVDEDSFPSPDDQGEGATRPGRRRKTMGELWHKNNLKAKPMNVRNVRACRTTEVVMMEGGEEDSPWVKCTQVNPTVTRRGFRGHQHHRSHSEDPPRPTAAVWGNGKDWGAATPREGGWVRVYPFGLPPPKPPSPYPGVVGPEIGARSRGHQQEVRLTVLEVQRFWKAARDVWRNHSDKPDQSCDLLLKKKLSMNGTLWKPKK